MAPCSQEAPPRACCAATPYPRISRSLRRNKRPESCPHASPRVPPRRLAPHLAVARGLLQFRPAQFGSREFLPENRRGRLTPDFPPPANAPTLLPAKFAPLTRTHSNS